MTDMTLGQRIAACRKKLNLSQEALGEKVGVSRQAISKWEADGTVPEIDKLIALSRLFGVSVGWLLGVEAEPAPAPARNGEISEELLRKVEEIVLRYRPRKQPMSTKKKVLIGVGIVLVLLLGGAWVSKWSNESSMLAFTYGQVQNINEQNASIQAQLNLLSSRLDDMTSAQEEQEKLLSDYSMELEVWEDAPGADVIFSAVPKNWAEGDSAAIAFQIPGEEAIREDCQWNGAFLSTRIPLEAKDGYQICLTIRHADGSQEQQMLSQYNIEHMARALTISFDITSGTAEFRFNGDVLEMEITDYEVQVTRPSIAGETVFFRNIDYVLYLCRANGHEEVERYELYDAPPLDSEVSGYGPDVWCYGQPTFTVPEIKDGDGLELWVKAELSNGMSAVEMAGSWAYNNGEFIAAVPVSE